MKPGAKERFQDLFFSTGRKWPTGSVTEYFQEVSNGKISFTGEVIGPFSLPQDVEYYANGDYGQSRAFPNARTMAADALDAATGKINFGPYDNDGNGYVSIATYLYRIFPAI